MPPHGPQLEDFEASPLFEEILKGPQAARSKPPEIPGPVMIIYAILFFLIIFHKNAYSNKSIAALSLLMLFNMCQYANNEKGIKNEHYITACNKQNPVYIFLWFCVIFIGHFIQININKLLIEGISTKIGYPIQLYPDKKAYQSIRNKSKTRKTRKRKITKKSVKRRNTKKSF